MTNSQAFQFAKRFRALAKDQRNLDFALSQLAREIRATFNAGPAGDERFHQWCESDLGTTRGESITLLERAAAAATAPDERTWNAAGGFKAVRSLRVLPKAEQVSALEIVKATGRSVRSVLMERARSQPRPDISPMAKPRKTPEMVDATILAEFIAANVPRDKQSTSIRKIVERYVASRVRAVA